MEKVVFCTHAENGKCVLGEGCYPILQKRTCPRMEGGSVEQHFNPATSISLIWNISDVKQAIENFQIDCSNLSNEKLMEVLEAVYDNHDANYGVNWETIASEADGLFVRDKESE